MLTCFTVLFFMMIYDTTLSFSLQRLQLIACFTPFSRTTGSKKQTMRFTGIFILMSLDNFQDGNAGNLASNKRKEPLFPSYYLY